MSDDRALLAAWITTHDAAAFSELARRHAGMVYGTCRRIVRDHHVAEEVAQECLLALARGAASVRESVAGYLHAIAMSRARDRLRAESARRRREDSAARDAAAGAGGEPTWSELAPLIDEALAALPDEQRVPLVMHFLEGRGQAEIADELRCGQATVSRRIALGIEALRQRLGGVALGLTVAALAATLTANAAETAPATLVTSAAKLALAGPGAIGATTVTWTAATAVKAALAALVVAAAALLVAHPVRRAHAARAPALDRRIDAGDPRDWAWKGVLGPGPDPADGRTCLAAERYAAGAIDVVEVYLATAAPPLWRYRADLVLSVDVAADPGTDIRVYGGTADHADFALPLPLAAGAPASRWRTISVPLADLRDQRDGSAPRDGLPFVSLVFSAPRGRFWIDNVRIAPP